MTGRRSFTTAPHTAPVCTGPQMPPPLSEHVDNGLPEYLKTKKGGYQNGSPQRFDGGLPPTRTPTPRKQARSIFHTHRVAG